MFTLRQTIPALVCAAAAIAGGCSLADGPEGFARGEPAPGAPNLIVIVTDDQTAEQFTPRTMPRTHRALVRDGVEFTDYIVTTPLCCPSRASYLTGQYVHNNGVVSNSYLKLEDKPNVLPAWLQRAGYTTSHVGKYMNNYAKSLDDEAAAPPGWDEWFTVLEPENYGNYSISDNGEVREYGLRPRDHVTRVLNDRAVEEVDRLAPRGRPFYLQLDHYAPHSGRGSTGGCPGGAAPERRDRGSFGDLGLPEKGSFDESVADKSSFLSGLPPLDGREKERIRARWQCALEALAGVDRGVERIVTALRRAGELDETAIVFTSDNGYFYGEHRLAEGKHYPYEEAIQVPLVVRPPRGAAYEPGTRSAAPVANIDLAPTLLELAQATPCIDDERCRAVDGRSLVPLLTGSEAEWPAPRPLLVELGLPPSNSGDSPRPCGYAAVREEGYVYVNYTSVGGPGENCEEVDERELYALADDPHQTENLLADPDAGSERLAARMAETLDELRVCGGAGRERCP